MPSTNSSSMPKVLDSATVTTPSLPTLSMASAITSPMDGSAAEMDATCAISDLSSMSLACALMPSTAAATAFSIPFLRAMGLAPAATLRKPSRTRAWASTVAVVVPSPATSLVLVATSFTSWAPMFSKGFSSSTSLALVTPSLVMVGGAGVAGVDVEGDELAALLGPAPRAHGENLAELGLLFGCIGNDDAADGHLVGLVGPYDDAIFEGLEVHPASG